MSSRIRKLSITDFRSIRGKITLDLDAPVVLIHGPNGAGKTSILSAIELGLTGHIPAMARVDSNYVEYLPHRECALASVSIVAGVEERTEPRELRIKREGIENEPLLGESEASFFSERCYLAQPTLSRLLEIYQHSDAGKSESQLTRFVKDLLGLDQLESLIDGLHAAGDRRRIKRLVPAYRQAEETLAGYEPKVNRINDDIAKTAAAQVALAQRLTTNLRQLEDSPKSPERSASQLEEMLNDESEEGPLTELAAVRRDVIAIQSQWVLLTKDPATGAQAAAEVEAAEASAQLTRWHEQTGRTIEELLRSLESDFPGLPGATPDPEHARRTAQAVATAEIERVTAQIDSQETTCLRLVEISEEVSRIVARTALIDSQIGELAKDSDETARVLAGVLPLVVGPECPVCGRDYSEVSDTSLAAHVSDHVTALREQTGRLQDLAREKAEISAALAARERESASLESRRLSQEALDAAKSRKAGLSDAVTQLQSLRAGTEEGVRLLAESSRSARALETLVGRDRSLISIRDEVAAIVTTLGLDSISKEESTGDAIARVAQLIETRQGMLAQRQSLRREAAKVWVEQKQCEEELSRLQTELAALKSEENSLRQLIDRADKLIGVARDLSRLARDARTDVVRTVFNDTLNKLWQELFIRLSPEEPFVPAFALPQASGGPVEAVLETRYNLDSPAGNPRAMLSAGNLNTAALTLFLALHLSVEAKLPWLVLDDPVQSMDDVHVSQFAALLRTVSKQHSRQVIIAVHERQLFEYLALELGPSFQGDRLITIELGRSSDGQTTVNYQPRVWRPDESISQTAS